MCFLRFAPWNGDSQSLDGWTREHDRDPPPSQRGEQSYGERVKMKGLEIMSVVVGGEGIGIERVTGARGKKSIKLPTFVQHSSTSALSNFKLYYI